MDCLGIPPNRTPRFAFLMGDGEGRIELHIPVSAARSLVRILTHLADLEEL